MIKSLRKDQLWKQINFRSVKTILGVEFLHDLYNQHWSPINSIRFRNTILIVDKGRVTSYTPLEEWNFLAEWFGERFLRGDDDIYKEVNNLINYKKPRLKKLLSKLKSINLKELDNTGLGLLLVDLHYTTLSEIYRVNIVQIEHALNYAIDKSLEKYCPNKIKRNEIIANIIVASEPTVATQEEKDFINLVYRGIKKGINKVSLKNSNFKQQRIFQMVKDHYHKYSFIHSAYGTNPYSLKYYLDRYNETAKQGIEDVANKIKIIEESIVIMKRTKEQYLHQTENDKILMKNINFIARIGTLRDKNKALLGTTMIWREKILSEIATRKKIKRSELNLYFLAEICDLLKHNRRLKTRESNKRRKGFILIRKEDIDFDFKKTKEIILDRSIKNKVLKGICASPGTYKGIVKIIKSSKDISKMRDGNVMVSPGTDFDLINAIQKAGAIITEEGGILSHAAVVSRELRIPCLIGVQDATAILKDGIRVKIKADKCVIIKKNDKI